MKHTASRTQIRRNLPWTGAATALLLGAANSSAAVVHNGWSYAIDAMNDGSGGAAYEQKGLAVTYEPQDGRLYFAISSNMPLGGNAASGARNGSAAYGDLFLNFSAHNLDTLAEYTDSRVFAVRFDNKNDSLNDPAGTATDPNTGVFGNIAPVALGTVNSGYASIQAYYNAGFLKANTMADWATSAQVQSHLGNLSSPFYANISGGTEVGEISLLDQGQLAAMGLDFGYFSAVGTQTFGFSLDLSDLALGSGPHDLNAFLFAECGNDGMAIHTAVPEPVETGVVMVMVAGFAAFLRMRRSR